MVYLEEANSLLVAGGATRDSWHLVDYSDAWLLDLGNTGAGWVATTDIPIAANHMSFTSAKDGNGNLRHYFMGGQEIEDEGKSEFDELFEYVHPGQWIERATMPITRGHASESTRKYGCGFVIAGGTERWRGKVRTRAFCGDVLTGA